MQFKSPAHRHLVSCRWWSSRFESRVVIIWLITSAWSNWRHRATAGPRQHVSRSAKLFVHLLLVTRSSFILFSLKYLKRLSFLSRLLLYVQAPHMLLTKTVPYFVFQTNSLLDTSCCRRKFKIICRPRSTVICSHFNNIYFWPNTMVICHFRINTVKDSNNDWPIAFQKLVPGWVSWPLGPNENILEPREEKSHHPGLHNTSGISVCERDCSGITRNIAIL
jgi:hypothetical protein